MVVWQAGGPQYRLRVYENRSWPQYGVGQGRILAELKLSDEFLDLPVDHALRVVRLWLRIAGIEFAEVVR